MKKKDSNQIISESYSQKIKKTILNDIQYYKENFSKEDLCYFKEYVRQSTFKNISFYHYINGNKIFYFTCEHIGLYFSVIESSNGNLYFLPDLYSRGLWQNHNELVEMENKSTRIIPVKNDHIIKVLNSILSETNIWLNKYQNSEMRRIQFVNLILELFKNIDLNICDLCYTYYYREMDKQSDVDDWFKENHLNLDTLTGLINDSDFLFLRIEEFGLFIIEYDINKNEFLINTVSIVPEINFNNNYTVVWGDSPLELECD